MRLTTCVGVDVQGAQQSQQDALHVGLDVLQRLRRDQNPSPSADVLFHIGYVHQELLKLGQGERPRMLER
jgi:hypothetical protein